MRSHFITVLQEYLKSTQTKFKENRIANSLRREFPDSIKKNIANLERYLVKGSPGNGRWVACPWIAILDLLVTDTTQKGYYPVYIFSQDMTGFYLTLNQGVTSVSQEVKTGYRDVLRQRAKLYQKQIKIEFDRFTMEPINLKKNNKTSSSLPGDYEAGNIISKYYPATTVPSEDVLLDDLREMLIIYENLVDANNLTSVTKDEENEIDSIRKSKRSETQKQRLINARLGQGEFRKDVVAIEKECRITKISDLAFLVASHIKPWSKSNDDEKLDGNNGLLLSPHVDKLFDKGFISFTEEGKVLIKDEAKDVYIAWNLKDVNVGSFNKKQQKYLAYHRKKYGFEA